ncbi:hypothetical protein Tco_0818107 [Tanacetum coccineum]
MPQEELILRRKKSWGSNINDGDKTVGGAIGARGSGIGDSLSVASYACITFIYGSSWKGEMASEAKRYLDKSSKGSGMEGLMCVWMMTDFALGRAVIDAAQLKRVKYEAECTTIGYGFLPFSFSSLGELEEDAVTLLKRIRTMVQEIGACAAIHIFNMIGFAVAKRVVA